MRRRYTEVLSIGPRGCGRTSVVALACRAIDATMLCANGEHAARVAKEYGVKTASIACDFKGLRGPYLLDHFAVERMAAEYEGRIDFQSRLLRESENAVERAQNECERMNEELRDDGWRKWLPAGGRPRSGSHVDLWMNVPEGECRLTNILYKWPGPGLYNEKTDHMLDPSHVTHWRLVPSAPRRK